MLHNNFATWFLIRLWFNKQNNIMKQDNKSIPQTLDAKLEQEQELTHELVKEQEAPSTAANETQQESTIDNILSTLGVSDSVATSAKAILDPIVKGDTPTQGLVALVVKALSHDDDVKNAEAAGYLRGRNETIEVANKFDDKEPQPVNFPIYRKRSFWDK